MKHFLIALSILAATPAGAGIQDRAAIVAFEGGRWFTGTGFEQKTAYVIDGVLTFRTPARVDSRVDLGGGYVVPPFGEAHNHNVAASDDFDQLVARYLEHGIFYVKNPNSLPRDRPKIAPRINKPTSIDAMFANGGWTGPGGHPLEIAKRSIDSHEWNEQDGEGGFYWTASSEAEIAGKWPSFMAQQPQFVKVYLLFSEEFSRRDRDDAFFGWKGLNPSLLTGLVRRAHAAGLRVSAHIETAADFHAAVTAGVDEVNHVPGFRGDMERPMSDVGKFQVSEADAELAAKNGTTVVTTLVGVSEVPAEGPTAAFRSQLEDLYRRNLRMLSQHKVKIAVGSDAYDVDSLAEAMYLDSLHVFEPIELLKMWTETTAKAIFPSRHIGTLDEGAEASFLVLRDDPTKDFSAVKSIVQRVKQGVILKP